MSTACAHAAWRSSGAPRRIPLVMEIRFAISSTRLSTGGAAVGGRDPLSLEAAVAMMLHLLVLVVPSATQQQQQHAPDDNSGTRTAPCTGTESYNGICTPAAFPPRLNPQLNKQVQDPVYLRSPPALINITIGRQLFVDDFLIESLSNAQRTFHSAQYDTAATNPIITPDKPWEGSFAMPFSGGVWWEDDKQRAALFYRCGGFAGAVQDAIRVKGRPWPPPDPHKPSNGGPSGMCVAYTTDGLTFTKPNLPVRPGTNMVRE